MGHRLNKAVALLLLFGLGAFAQNKPRMYQPDAPVMVVAPDWVLTNEGRDKLAAALERQSREVEQIRAENASLRADILKASDRPALTWGGALLLVGGGVVLGALVAIPIVTAVRR